MRKYFLLLVAAFVSAVASLNVTPAFAQATRTWVSGVGDDANPCSRTAPCKTFAGAISKTAAGGEINCIDAGGFGGVTITKSMAIVCDNVEAGVLVAGTNGIVINAAAADVVFLSGLDIHGVGTGTNGINFLAGAALHVKNSSIRRFTTNGIKFSPSGASELYVNNTYVSENGANGILIQPTGTGSANASIERTSTSNTLTGFKTDGTGSTGGINMTITNCVAAGNTNAGISLFNPAGGATTNVMVQQTAAVNNGAPGGLRADGPNATLRVGSSIITGNGTGTVILNGGIISSYGNNQIDGNTVNGPNPPTIALK